ncbi:YoaP domain-containing protein [Finegoldia magna]|uniref:YoaP domain-containing protein n=1 Tax=Finegoldia magna TaxID=1260 RepID=UPI001F5B7A39|nr:YoaP domain-containing protein [Finegoldia magna]
MNKFAIFSFSKIKRITQTVHIHSKQQAQQAPTPCTTYALFYDGKWISNEQQNEKKFLKLIEEVR